MAIATWTLAAALGAMMTFADASAAPFVPDGDAVVLERLPESRDAALGSLKKLRTLQRARPDDLRIATSFARKAIDASRATGDPRWLGQAQAALAPWWSAPDAPDNVVLLRATIKQSQHDFDGALADLDALVAAHPDDAQARLTRATVRTVVGRHADALADCTMLAARVPALVSAACSAGPASQAGDAVAAAQRLDAALDSSPQASAAIRAWALTLAAELAQRRGEAARAEMRFREARTLDPRDPYLLGAYADFLLDQDRAREVVALLRDEARNDALLLRLTLAEARLPAARADYDAHRAELGARFDATRLRGDTLHRREEARYALEIERDPGRAVGLARANFTLQREPADLRILVESAVAANDADALRAARDWTKRTGDADVIVAAALRGKP